MSRRSASARPRMVEPPSSNHRHGEAPGGIAGLQIAVERQVGRRRLDVRSRSMDRRGSQRARTEHPAPSSSPSGRAVHGLIWTMLIDRTAAAASTGQRSILTSRPTGAQVWKAGSAPGPDRFERSGSGIARLPVKRREMGEVGLLLSGAARHFKHQPEPEAIGAGPRRSAHDSTPPGRRDFISRNR